ncbi:hypothetical protein I4F81_008293 [Pyropia yezoensis]|uniref:Uncharacterized protein n=1 Tax=Pyropia yezoensis TaxID=2788 RepID=A0ACC3C6C4_PYRYE|nr:hypothetical protein I4F81_008293 [Neopyropia yezoensis]
MPSMGMGTLNALLNCAMMLTYAAAALAIERAYVYAATLHLAAHGVTGATNSAEVHVSHWVTRAFARVWRRRRPPEGVAGGGSCGDSTSGRVGGGEEGGDVCQRTAAACSDEQGVTAAAAAAATAPTAVVAADGGAHRRAVRPLWSVALLLLLLALLPAELFSETGIGEEPRGTTSAVVRPNGVCASPWTGHSAVGVAAAALLAQRLNWLDPVWTAVPVGASKAMLITERFAWPPGPRRLPGGGDGAWASDGATVAADCTVVVGACTGADGCGNLLIHRTDGPFHTVVEAASGAGVTNGTFPAATDAPSRYAAGDLTYDGATGVAFFFWEEPPPPDEAAAATAAGGASAGGTARRVYVAGVEVVLNASEMARVLHPDPAPWVLDADPARARTYAVALSTNGLRAADVVMAASIYRTSQMEQPGVRRVGVDGQIERLPPLTPSDVLKAVYALKAEDGRSTCAGTVGVYVPRGTVRLVTLLPFAVALVVVGGVWVGLAAATRGLADLHVPHDADSWRSFALVAHGWGGPPGSPDGDGWKGGKGWGEEGGGGEGGGATPAAPNTPWPDDAAASGGRLTSAPPAPHPPTPSEGSWAGVASMAAVPLPPAGSPDGSARGMPAGAVGTCSPGRPAVVTSPTAVRASFARESSSDGWQRLSGAEAAAGPAGRGRDGGRRVQVAPPSAAVAPGVVFLSS